MPSIRHFLLCGLFALGACDSKVTSTLDPVLQAKADTITQCFPEHLAKLNALLEFADLWRLSGGTNPPDPAGLTWSEQPDGTIDVTIALTGFTITSTISFYSPTGLLQNLTLPATSLSAAIDAAATELRNLFGAANPFMVGEWTMSGAGVTGSGALTGIIGGSANQNELEELRTTGATPSGGPPAVADGTIELTGTHTCEMTFNTPSLVTDGSPTQEYPIGVITVRLEKTAATVTTVNAAFTMDGTATGVLTVDTVPGRFEINLETRSIFHRR